MEDPELEYYKDGCLAERERADEAEDELQQIREAIGALAETDLVSLAATLRRRHELCTAGHGELQHELLRAKAMLNLAWANTVKATGEPFDSWLQALEKQMEDTI